MTPFINAIERFGDCHAFCINEKFYTYAEFAETLSKIRKAIQIFGNSNPNIGLISNDDIETYASIFAIWLEGFAYVPIHPNQPIERSLEIISQADVTLIIDSSEMTSFNTTTVLKSTGLEEVQLDLKPKTTPDEALAYILFTSGSTGKPKGVPISRGNIASFIKSFWEVGFMIDHNDRCLQTFDLTFDVSVQSYLVPLTRGACTYTIPHDQIKYSYVYGLLDDHQLTFGAFTPSMIRYLKPYFSEISVPGMKYCILTAEASPVALISEWAQCLPNAEIYDFYGPTEATIYCTYKKFNKEGFNKNYNGLFSIGKAMNGLTAIIVDEDKNILETNQKGELCISGPQVTMGYWKNQEKNRESFFAMQIDSKPHRFYRTGDLCYLDEDGDILYSGRMDFQVKIQGYRVELGEIEFHAREYLKGQNTVATSFENFSGNTEIALIIEGTLLETKSLLDYLNSKLPFYMIPTKIISHDIFPLNANGKVDRNMLRNSILN